MVSTRRTPFKVLALLLACAAALFAIVRVSPALNADSVGTANYPVKNEIDKFVLAALREQKIEPSATCTDEEFLRRVYLDVCGLIPTRAEVKKFMADRDNNKRAKLIDELLKTERHADHEAVLWSDMLREHTNGKRQEGTERGSYRDWLREALHKNLPYDQFVTQLICSSGIAEDNGAVNFYLRDEANRVETSNAVSQIFMGTRMACAQCHDHPFDKWTQEDFHSVMAFLGRVSVAPDPIATLLKIDKAPGLTKEAREVMEPYFVEAREAEKKAAEDAKLKGNLRGANQAMGMPGMAGMGMLVKGRDFLKDIQNKIPADQRQRVGQIVQNNLVKQVFERPTGEYRMPTEGDGQNKKNNKGDVVEAVFPWNKKKHADKESRRAALAEFIVAEKQFAAVQVNRIWAQYMGRGIVDPVDDFREKNAPSHPELLDYLADEFVKAKFNNHHIQKLILNSNAYQRSSIPTTANRSDETYYSHQPLRKLTGEQMFDSILIATGREKGITNLNREDLGGGRGGGGAMRDPNAKNEIQWAVDLPTPARTGSFMNTFNQPIREEIVMKRDQSGSITQALEMLNGNGVSDAVRNSPLIKDLFEQKLTPQQAVTELYLAALSRNPSAREAQFCCSILKQAAPTKEWMEDLQWALLNAREFAFIK